MFHDSGEDAGLGIQSTSSKRSRPTFLSIPVRVRDTLAVLNGEKGNGKMSRSMSRLCSVGV